MLGIQGRPRPSRMPLNRTRSVVTEPRWPSPLPQADAAIAAFKFKPQKENVRISAGPETECLQNIHLPHWAANHFYTFPSTQKSQDIIATPCSSPFVTHAFTSVYIQSSEPPSPSRYKTSPSRPPAAPPHFNERLHTLPTTGNAVPAAVSWQEHHTNGIAPRAAF